jgi:hypothetical protein
MNNRRDFFKKLGLGLGILITAPAVFLDALTVKSNVLHFTLREELGFLVLNPSGVKRLIITRPTPAWMTDGRPLFARVRDGIKEVSLDNHIWHQES